MEEIENYNTVLQELHRPTITPGTVQIKPYSSSPGTLLVLLLVGFVLVNRLNKIGGKSSGRGEGGDKESELQKEYAYAFLKREYKRHADRRKRIDRY